MRRPQHVTAGTHGRPGCARWPWGPRAYSAEPRGPTPSDAACPGGDLKGDGEPGRRATGPRRGGGSSDVRSERESTIVGVTIVVVAGIAYGIGASGGNSAGGAPVPPADITALNQASTSTVGVTASTITVAFPVSNLEALSSNLGFEADVEYSEQAKAINLFVDQINQSGGINGRKIKPEIVDIDPTDEAA